MSSLCALSEVSRQNESGPALNNYLIIVNYSIPRIDFEHFNSRDKRNRVFEELTHISDP